MEKQKKTAPKHSARQQKVIPTVSLDGARILVAGCCWTPPRRTFQMLLKAGATGIGVATRSSPGIFVFPDAKKARAAFEGAFNAPNDWGMETLPDETRWNDSAGMADIAAGIING